jgi:hypothetical protein
MEQIPLEPARPEAGENPSEYMPRIAWKWVIGIGAFLTLSIGTCRLRDRQELESLRHAVRGTYDADLAPVVKRYASVSEHVRHHVLAAAEKPAERYVDPRLKLDVLGTSPGLYLRIRATDGRRGDALFSDSATLPPDAIARCLGLAPADANDLLRRGSFLEPDFIAQAEEADSIMKLRVVAEEMRQRSERDLPTLAESLKAKWFLLAVERGESRQHGPVDIYLWDIDEDSLLLSAHTESHGALVAARIAVGGVTPQAYPDGAQTGGAQDCAIANSVRAIAGGGAPAFESAPPTPRAAVTEAKLASDQAPNDAVAPEGTSPAKTPTKAKGVGPMKPSAKPSSAPKK